ncbi:MAG TPA: ATP-binding protein [Stellaceae bacterium]|nr:ATP-binding protein [Stellaceae bacterium]
MALSTGLAVVGWVLLSQSATAAALFAAALGLALLCLVLAIQRNRLRDYANRLRQSHEALRRSEARFRAFAMVSSDWFWEQGVDLRFTYFSDERRKRYVGTLPWELPGDATSAECWAAHRKLLAERQAFHDFRLECADKHGRRRSFSISGEPMLDAAGVFLGYRGTGRDITAQIEGEDALKHAKDAAEAASRTKSQILATVSHELRTPLNAIIGFSEVISQALMGPVDPRYREYAKDIHKAGTHLLTLINDVLDLSKIEVGQLKLHERAVDVAQLISGCHRLVAERARESLVRINEVAADDIPLVFGDELRLKQIVLNLLSNAVKFTAAGGTGGRVTIDTRRTTDGGLIISIADTGIGMKPEDIPIALSPFRQLDNAFNRRSEGTGLGLPLAKMLVELHDGALEIESKVGIGTTVRVHLPSKRVLPPDAAQGKEAASLQEISSSG